MTAAPTPTQSPTDRSKLMIGKGSVQGVAIVVIFGFFIMGLLAFRTYTASMPIPDRVVTSNGDVLFTGEDITAGQELFLARGLMQYGSIVGHGAYLGTGLIPPTTCAARPTSSRPSFATPALLIRAQR